MISNINYTSKFNSLKEFYIPAFCHTVLKGHTKFHQLSITLNGQELKIKKSSKKFKYASFADVILGSVLRMKKLFAPDALDLGVNIINQPVSNNLLLSFELVNKNKFIIAGEEYILSIVAEYSYKRLDTVTYFPVLYRQTCTNGQVAILADQFKENVSVDKIFEIGCEWTRCNFENYSMQLNNYFELLKSESLNMIDSKKIDFIEKVLKINISRSNKQKNKSEQLMDLKVNSRSVQDIIGDNFERLGNNNFALYNSLTEYASQEFNWERRNNYFLNIGRYLNKEIKKSSKINRSNWAEKLVWQEVEKLSKS